MCTKYERNQGLPLLPSEVEATHYTAKQVRAHNRTSQKFPSIRRGDIYYADLGLVKGSEQGGQRPVLIIQNNVGNKYSPTVIVAPITAKTNKKPIPTHVPVCMPNMKKNGQPSTALLEQIRTIDKTRLMRCVGRASSKEMEDVGKALVVSLAIQ